MKEPRTIDDFGAAGARPAEKDQEVDPEMDTESGVERELEVETELEVEAELQVETELKMETELEVEADAPAGRGVGEPAVGEDAAGGGPAPRSSAQAAEAAEAAGVRGTPDVSVLVPLTERAESLVELYEEYAAPLEAAGIAFDFIFLAEPWFREETAPLRRLVAAGAPVRVLEVGQSVGEAALLKLGAERTEAPVVLTLPAYHRVEAEVLPHLLGRVEKGVDVAVARRWPRRDSWINRAQGTAFHWLTGGFARRRLHDLGCGVRAIRREVLQELPLYGDFFRFLPVLALREGFRVEEFPARQHPLDVRTRLYSPGTYLRRLIDLLGLFFLLRFTEKPLRFFGLVGSASSFAGLLILAGLVVDRMQGQPLADRPLLLLGVLLLVLGAQAIALGLVGEIIVHLHAPERHSYRLARERPLTR